jgi:hypothetical protein
MSEHQSDAMLFIRLAGTQAGVLGRHIPLNVIATVTDFGGKVSFQGDRIFVRNSAVTFHRVLGVATRARTA